MSQDAEKNLIRHLPRGTRIEVVDAFEDSFCRGFEIAGESSDGYRVRRLSDGIELPVVFPPERVRTDRGGQPLM